MIFIEVPVTESEYARLRRDAALTAPGTLWAALRDRAGMPAEPYRHSKYDMATTTREATLR
jgi:hypothetical protein